MVKYSCGTCLKDFSQKSHYDKHIIKKNPCVNNINKIKESLQTIINEIKIELNINNSPQLSNIQINKEQMEEIKQKKGLKRNPIDKYYTKSNIVDQCIESIKKHIIIYKHPSLHNPNS